MELNTFEAYIKQVSKNTPAEDIPLLVSFARHRHLKKGAPLLKEGEVCRCFYLVHKGYLRTWYNKDGMAINLNFTFEGEFASNLKSFRTHEPSEVIIEAGENASVWVFDLSNIDKKLNSHPEVILFIRRLAMYLSVTTEEQANFFKMYTPCGTIPVHRKA